MIDPSTQRLALIERLRALDACSVADALQALGVQAGGAVNGLRPMWDCARVAGTARTLTLRRLQPGETPAARQHLGSRSIAASSPGDVIVIDHQLRTDSAGWGGLLCAAAAVAGVRAVVVYGACRDVDDAVALGLPLFAASATPVSARSRTLEAAVDEPIDLGGTQVSPGDYLIADRSGVVVVPAASIIDVLATAEQLYRDEQHMLQQLQAGTPVGDVLGTRYENALIQTSKEA